MSISKEVGKSCSAFRMAADWMVLVLVDRSGMEEEEEWEEEEKGRDACHGCCSRRRTDDGALRVPQMKAAYLRWRRRWWDGGWSGVMR